MPDDYYALLGVDPDASEEAILRAYRERVAEHHPDVSDADDAGETFRRLNRAKDVLTDEARRREYDSLGHERYLERVGDDNRDPPDSASGSGPEVGFPGRAGRSHDGGSTGGTPDWARGRFRGASIDAGGPFGPRERFDLRSFLRPTGPWSAGRERTETDQASASQSRPCPRCHGRGRFVHELDTALGRRRRIEPCERCGGDGKVDR